MRVLRLMCLLALAVAGCSADPKSQIVGRWEPTDTSSDLQALEFDAGGALKVHLKGDPTPVEGTYELEGGKLLKVKIRNQIESRLQERVQRIGTNTVSLPFWIMTEKQSEVSLSPSELTVSDGDKKRTLKRAK